MLRLFALAILCTSVVQRAYGYIDPGTGSYVVQLLIAGLATGLYAIKYFWSNIKAFFTTPKKKTEIKTGRSSRLHAKKK